MKLTNITLKYGEKTVYDNFNIDFDENKITCIMGASGCGKTTILNVIAGTVKYDGDVEKKSKNISYIFQQPTLLNHLTVRKNIEFVLKKQYKNKIERERKVNEILNDIELYSDANSYPSQLSGGMAQRVSLGRAFAYDSDILLMDEPFKGLDLALTKKIHDLFLRLIKKNPKTVIFVTHDPDEAILFADKIIILGQNSILYETDLPDREKRNVSDFPEIRTRIYEFF